MLAIVIPYYKYDFFEATLNSIASQTDKRFKVFIGDDASLQNPLELISKYNGKFNFIYHRFEDNLGGISLTKQWERCIDLIDDTNIEWIQILGDDDVLSENVIEEFYKNVEFVNVNKINVVRYASIVINGDSEIISNVYNNPIIESPFDSYSRRIQNISRSSLSEHIFRKTKYEEFNFYNFPIASHSDDLAWIQYSDGGNIYSINNSLIYIRVSNINITGRKDNIKLKRDAQFQYLSILLDKYYYEFDSNIRFLIYVKFLKLKKYYTFFKGSYITIIRMDTFLKLKKVVKYLIIKR